VWKRLVKQMARENTKFHQVRPQDEANYPAGEALMLFLLEQQLVRQVRRLDRPQQPIESYVYHSKYKYYMQDTGLFRRLAGLPATAVNAEEPALSRFRGILSESYALQSLISLSNQGPWYWKSGHQAEVDFVLLLDDAIVPVEVKTARNVTSHSLARYRQLYTPEIALRLSLLNLKRDDDLVNIPLYMSECIPHILSLFRKKETP
jgi:predicted AAA+ superfamily ATPase